MTLGASIGELHNDYILFQSSGPILQLPHGIPQTPDVRFEFRSRLAFAWA